ncbi:MAG: aspartate aminotransferase family protein [Cyclobacteriaceae bacterium]|nr:aspartate aminotransferase family protein [Cyclobacteriaceae bacterium]
MEKPLQHLNNEGDINLGSQRRLWNDQISDQKTREYLHRDAEVFLHQTLSSPCLHTIEKAEGCYIFDTEGKAYLDFHGNNVHHVGYGNPKVKQRIMAQMDTLPFCPRRYTNATAIELAEKLVARSMGSLSRVLFAPGGSLAMGMALKLARAATGRYKTISMFDAFHGASLDMISIGGEAVFRKNAGPLLAGTHHVPPADPGQCPFHCETTCNLQCAKYIEYILEKEGDIAAVIAETVRSTPYIPPPEYWKTIRNACDKHGALLILDEIPHGMGRTGSFFTFQQYDVVPDMVVIGKSLGGGIMPLAALLAREALNDFIKDKSIGHYTHEKSPVACAAGLAVLEVLEEQSLISEARVKGEYMMQKLLELKQKHKIVYDVRGLGLLLGVELRHENGDRAEAIAEKVMYSCLGEGLNFKISMGNILTLTPPLVIDKAQIDKAVDILENAFLALKV